MPNESTFVIFALLDTCVESYTIHNWLNLYESSAAPLNPFVPHSHTIHFILKKHAYFRGKLCSNILLILKVKSNYSLLFVSRSGCGTILRKGWCREQLCYGVRCAYSCTYCRPWVYVAGIGEKTGNYRFLYTTSLIFIQYFYFYIFFIRYISTVTVFENKFVVR